MGYFSVSLEPLEAPRLRLVGVGRNPHFTPIISIDMQIHNKLITISGLIKTMIDRALSAYCLAFEFMKTKWHKDLTIYQD